MTCAGFEEGIARYVGGDLAPEDAAEIAQHFRVCADCAELARQLEEDRVWLASRPPEAAEVDFAAMRREIRREVLRPRRSWKRLAAAAAILLAVGLAASLRRTPAPRQVVPVTQVARDSSLPVLAQKETAVAQKRFRKQRRVQPPAEPNSPVEIRIATRDPNVTIILLHETRGELQ